MQLYAIGHGGIILFEVGHSFFLYIMWIRKEIKNSM